MNCKMAPTADINSQPRNIAKAESKKHYWYANEKFKVGICEIEI